jgi:hypothetical protein
MSSSRIQTRFLGFMLSSARSQPSSARFLQDLLPSRFQHLLVVFLLLAPCLEPRAHAQAMPTASKSNDISAFAGYSYANPMYGPDYDHGFSFGANFVHHLPHFPIDPSIEARINLLSGADVSERSYLFGVRAQTLGYFHVHPYADFLVGAGDIYFHLTNGSTYISDNSLVYNYGGGFDIDVYKQYQLKIDMQSQNWSIGHGSGDNFNPWIGMVGVTYRLHFRDYNKQGDAK